MNQIRVLSSSFDGIQDGFINAVLLNGLVEPRYGLLDDQSILFLRVMFLHPQDDQFGDHH